MSEPERIPDANPPCPYVTGTVTRYCTLTPFTITAEEREAIAWCRDNLTAMAHTASAFAYIHAATLRGLLERLGAANSGEDRRSGGGE